MLKGNLFTLLFIFILLVVFGFTIKKQTAIINRINVEYAKANNLFGQAETLTMNVYYPHSAVEGKKYPMVMLMHGGTFLTGSKENMVKQCEQMADSGFIAVTINYRKGWNFLSRLKGCDSMDVKSLSLATYRALQDGHAALRFLTAHAKEYGIDTDWIFVGGASAGAINALNIVYLDNDYAKANYAGVESLLGRVDTSGNSYTNTFKVKAICGMWGALPDSNMVTKAKAVPAIFFHGTGDNTVPYDKGSYGGCNNAAKLYGSACIYRQLRALGKAAVLNTSIGGKHGPLEFTPPIIISNTACFFKAVMRGNATSASYTDAKAGCRQ